MAKLLMNNSYISRPWPDHFIRTLNLTSVKFSFPKIFMNMLMEVLSVKASGLNILNTWIALQNKQDTQ